MKNKTEESPDNLRALTLAFYASLTPNQKKEFWEIINELNLCNLSKFVDILDEEEDRIEIKDPDYKVGGFDPEEIDINVLSMIKNWSKK